MLEYLKTIVSLGILAVYITFRGAVQYICFTGKGETSFFQITFHVQESENLEQINLTFAQNVDRYDSDSVPLFLVVHIDTSTKPISINRCKYYLKILLNILPSFLKAFLKDRKTNFKTVCFNFSGETNGNLYCYTSYPLNDLVIITLNMNKLTSYDLFLNTAIHEIIHMLVPGSVQNSGHDDDFYHTSVCVLLVTSYFPTISFFPTSTFLSTLH